MDVFGSPFFTYFGPAVSAASNAWKNTASKFGGVFDNRASEATSECDGGGLRRRPHHSHATASARWKLPIDWFHLWSDVLRDRLMDFAASGAFETKCHAAPASLEMRSRLTFNLDEAAVRRTLLLVVSAVAGMAALVLVYTCRLFWSSLPAAVEEGCRDPLSCVPPQSFPSIGDCQCGPHLLQTSKGMEDRLAEMLARLVSVATVAAANSGSCYTGVGRRFRRRGRGSSMAGCRAARRFKGLWLAARRRDKTARRALRLAKNRNSPLV